jgi:hypothetical protein
VEERTGRESMIDKMDEEEDEEDISKLIGG